MPNNASAKKRVRQDDVRRVRNRSAKRELRTLTKSLLSFVEEKNKDAAESTYRTLVAKLDRAGQTRLLHPNNTARQKSRLAKLVSSL